jgi:peptidyl-prolyl cis-trans isomerase B (cyclophilin B)
MPSVQEIRALQKARRKARRRKMYLLGTLIPILLIAIAVIVYASIQPGGPPSGSQAIVYAKLATSQGVIEIELYHSSVPKTVDNFVNLAKSGSYSNLVWHRIAKNFVIQTGNSNSKNGLNNSTWSQGDGTPQIPFENNPSLHNAVGYVGMASTGAGVGGSDQFYININDNSAKLDGSYMVFGKVINGMNAAYAIGNLPIYNPPDGQPINPSDAMLISVTISNTP